MNPLSNRTKFWLVAGGYAAVFAVAAAMLFAHRLVELQDPAAASGGMAAFGETLLYLFIGCLFLVPTAFLVLFLAKFEAQYTAYTQFLLALSLTAPVCMCVAVFGENHVPSSLSWFCFYRIMESPILLVAFGMSRFAARSKQAKRFSMYALLVEALTLVLAVAGFVGGIFIHW